MAYHRSIRNGNNRLLPEDRAAHEWYRFVLSYPPHLVRGYLQRFSIHSGQCVLDPFCGTGTTLVECKKHSIRSVGIEANPMACFASRVKVDWTPSADGLRAHAQRIGSRAAAKLKKQGIKDTPALIGGGLPDHLRSLSPELDKLLVSHSISPLPLHKVLVLLDCLEHDREDHYYEHERLALAKALVFAISNLVFGPEIGVGKAKLDAPVISAWLGEVNAIARDLTDLRQLSEVPSQVYLGDSRQLDVLEPNSIDAVITSPPYPNEKDYTRTTRLESVLLGFVQSKADLKSVKQNLVRSNTRGVYKGDDDDTLVAEHPEIQRIAQAIESRRIELGKTSGFERMYPRVTKLYFGGMARHLARLRSALRPGAQLAYVVGDQASYLRIMIRTGTILSDIARTLGYEVEGIDLFRTRLATATGEQLREEVVILRWPGEKGK